MVRYKVIIHPSAMQDLQDIYTSTDRWSFDETHAYVSEIYTRCNGLETMPHRFGFDQHTHLRDCFRSFQHKAHKVFFQINEHKCIVDIVAILPSRSQYSNTL